jgi:hypothetical protein
VDALTSLDRLRRLSSADPWTSEDRQIWLRRAEVMGGKKYFLASDSRDFLLMRSLAGLAGVPPSVKLTLLALGDLT